ncbi:MAG: Ku protein [Acidimicrobiia bacterium]|nr:Ku protein [Acidimicrobiia bacterium]MDH4308015.1 Ku protein [Acidimicrobiia bacterium]MDH5292288.1 Ku protein [Acidimicrobiia bacterium]
MRSIWKGAVSFGLVTIPVALFSATEDRTPKFKMLRGADGSPIKYKRVAEADGQEVTWEEIVKGFEVEKGTYVTFTDDELAAASAKAGAKLVDVVQFVDASEIDPMYYKSSYFLAPERTGVKAYRILIGALEDGDKVGIAKVAIREKQQLATIRAKDGVLVLETMYWPDEIRKPEFEELDVDVEIRSEEVAMATMLIENMTRPFDESEYVDQTRERISELAQQKLEGQEIVVPEAPEPTKVVDLLEALKASVEATKSAKKAAS